MVRKKISDFLLYRSRYSIAFVSILVLLLVVLTLAGVFLPGGLSEAELKSASSSIHTPLLALNGDETDHLIDLPYHLLQKLSIMLLGVTALAIKLPSLVVAFIGIIALYGVLRLWFRRNTAIMTSVIAMTSAHFLLIAQLGTPQIAYIFWPAMLLLTTSMIAYSEKFATTWLVVAAAVGALSLYTPLMVYLVFALLATCLIHPHARFVVFKQPKIILAISGVVFLLLLTPLILGSIYAPTVLANILGFSSLPAVFSLEYLLGYIAPYTQLANPTISTIVTPIYSLVIVLLIVIGAIRLVTTKYTAKSYILSILFLFLILGAFAGVVPAAFTFVPAMVLVAFALSYIIRSWYELFPLNPYARIAGLLPLAVLLAGISLSELDRYIYGVQYSTRAQVSFQKDVKMLRETIQQSNDKFVLVTTKNRAQFYTDFAERTKTKSGTPLIVTSDRDDARAKSGTHTIITIPMFASSTSIPTDILVSSNSGSSARFYLYKNDYR